MAASGEGMFYIVYPNIFDSSFKSLWRDFGRIWVNGWVLQILQHRMNVKAGIHHDSRILAEISKHQALMEKVRLHSDASLQKLDLHQ